MKAESNSLKDQGGTNAAALNDLNGTVSMLKERTDDLRLVSHILLKLTDTQNKATTDR